jgi:organic hydroperoxide reductase OsmC/OhrA
MNTIFLLVAGNSKFGLKNLQTKATVKMNIEGMEKLIFPHIHFTMNISLVNDSDRERKKAERIYQMAQKICPLIQYWGEDVPISFELNYV